MQTVHKNIDSSHRTVLGNVIVNLHWNQTDPAAPHTIHDTRDWCLRLQLGMDGIPPREVSEGR